LARDLFAELAEEHAALCTRIAALDRRLRNWRNENAVSRRLTAIPGVGPLIASLLVMKTPDPHLFKPGRDFAAWLVQDRTAAKNRGKVLAAPLLKRRNAQRLEQIKRQITAIEAAILEQVQADPDLAQRFAILTSIPGVSAITAFALAHRNARTRRP
jgi:transposase